MFGVQPLGDTRYIGAHTDHAASPTRHAIASAKAERIRPYAAAQVLWESAGDARPTLLRDYWL
jgi:hypothetical protein